MKDFGSTKGSPTQRSGPAENCCRLAFSPCNLLGYLKTAHEGFLRKYFMFKAWIAQEAGVARTMGLDWRVESLGTVQLSCQAWY